MTILLKYFLFCNYSSSESEEEKPMPKKPLKFKNKKEAMEAFKALLKEKVKSDPEAYGDLPMGY